MKKRGGRGEGEGEVNNTFVMKNIIYYNFHLVCVQNGMSSLLRFVLLGLYHLIPRFISTVFISLLNG